MLGAALHKIMYRQPLKYSTDCKYNITLEFYNIFKAGKYKGLKAYIMKKNNHKTKECIHRQHFADMKFA